MKKILIMSLIISPVFTLANSNYKMIIGNNQKIYIVDKPVVSYAYEDWTNIDEEICTVDNKENDFYYGIDFEQTENCVSQQARNVTKIEEYKNGFIKRTNSLENREFTSQNVNLLVGTHLENSCYNILNNGFSSGSKVYKISNGLNVYCDQVSDGGGWTLVFNHNISNGVVFIDKNEVLNSSQNSPSLSTNKYSILNNLEEFRRNSKIEFKIAWAGYSKRNIWRQSTNPTINQNGGVSGYEAISINSSANYWGGLEYGYNQNSQNTLIDGSVNDPSWYYSVGSFNVWLNQGIPSSDDMAGSGIGVPNVNLWVR